MAEDRASGVSGWLLAPISALGGLAASASFMPFNLWPLAFVAVALLAWAVGRARGVPAAVGQGWTFGLFFMATSLIWQTSILVLSYTGLTVVMSLFYAALGGALRAVRHLTLSPLWAAATWTLMEWVMSVFPFGGFAWMRLGYTQLDSWLAGLYPLAGAASVTFVVALLGHLMAALVERPGLRRTTALVGTLAGSLALGLPAAAWLPTAPATPDAVTVGWVQPGAPGGGVYGLGPARTIAYNARDETARLVSRVRSGAEPAPAFIAWPENSTDMDPRADWPTRDAVTSAVADAGVPILVGSIYTDDARRERQTVALWWDADGSDLVYAKRNLVPFGEWIPLREFFLPLVPQLAYVGHQSVPGTTAGSFPARLADGRTIRVGVAICYEVIYPETMYEAARDAQVVIVQSSNAMYQGTIQIDQQFAATRVRAAEMRREVLVVTTSGLSGLIGQRGEVLDVVAPSVAASGTHTLPLRTTQTPAMVAGRWMEALVAVVGAFGVLLGSIRARLLGRGGRMGGRSRSRGE